MPAAFTNTTRALDVGGRGPATAMLVVGVVVALAWSAWFFLVPVPVRVVSRTARLEVDQVAHPIQAPLAGRVVAVHVHQGDAVANGQPMLELDAESQRLELAESEAKLAARTAELAALEEQLAVERHALTIEQGGAKVASAEAKARAREASIASSHARRRREQLETLSADGFVADNERIDASATAERSAALADALRQSVHGVVAQKRLGVAQRQAGIEALERQATVIAGEVRTMATAAARLRHEIDRRTIRAPVDGGVVELAGITVGAMVQPGDRIGVVLPAGTLRATAELDPADALGRVQPGQLAQLRLDGFPWAQHGVVEGRIGRVAGEVRSGTVHVELELEAVGTSIPLQHGLPGTLEIELERASPVTLVLRAAGKALAEPAGTEAEP